MCSDAVRESCGLWFSTGEESRAELPLVVDADGTSAYHG